MMQRHLIAIALAITACGKRESAVDKAAGDPSAVVVPHEDRHQQAIAPGKLALDVSNAGVKTAWGEVEFAAVAKIDGTASDGEARDTWSLRELVHHHAGPTARAITVIGENGRVSITPPEWDDPARTPILHTTRRGTLKFRWRDATGKWGQTIVKDVTGIAIVSK